MESCVLFQNSTGSVVLIDLPKSIEECQVRPGQALDRTLIQQAAPPQASFSTPDPKKSGVQRDASLPPSVLLAELMAAETVRDALQQVYEEYSGPWTISRTPLFTVDSSTMMSGTGSRNASKGEENSSVTVEDCHFPSDSHYISGSICDTRDYLLKAAPMFDVIVLDPPWPNRSAKRKKNNYSTMGGLEEARTLLELIPVPAKLSDAGLVAVWITNSPGAYILLTGPKGMLSDWGLQIVAEWIWLKVTLSGKPLFDIDSERRKPWERLLIAKRKGAPALNQKVENKVIISAPDVHSRKPHLRPFFDSILGNDYRGLEVFARNLTSGWWSWGDEVLKFQNKKYWNAAQLEEYGEPRARSQSSRSNN
ncbi:hypothetical protein MKZ38_009639 [Zalerion maritima]|uniref:MT-A70-domain-containing protein n=1 Tax=Zalerion maritima TaxID=339359 RepID=A0AAD5WUK9_9PEZI|nr:hypothetical protein MKZ38_009639 [Zalerion maritima]